MLEYSAAGIGSFTGYSLNAVVLIVCSFVAFSK
jgi:hypothetical protein